MVLLSLLALGLSMADAQTCVQAYNSCLANQKLRCGCKTHEVVAGDGAYKLGGVYGVNWHDLCKCNGMEPDSCNGIQIGQKLKIPCKEGEKLPAENDADADAKAKAAAEAKAKAEAEAKAKAEAEAKAKAAAEAKAKAEAEAKAKAEAEAKAKAEAEAKAKAEAEAKAKAEAEAKAKAAAEAKAKAEAEAKAKAAAEAKAKAEAEAKAKAEAEAKAKAANNNAKCGCEHEVVSGDYAYKIASKYNLQWQQICDCNKLDHNGESKACDQIKPGDKLKMPCPAKNNAAPAPAPAPKPAQTPAPKPAQTPAPKPADQQQQQKQQAARVLPNLTGPVKREYWTKKVVGTNWQREGTYYGEWDETKGGHKAMTRTKVQAVGACGLSGIHNLPAFGKDVMPIAVSTAKDYDNSLVCGMCVEYIGTGRVVKGKFGGNDPIAQTWQKGIIVDGCAGCHKGDFDLAKNGDGRFEINWRAVDCNTGSSKFEYVFTGSHNWYVKFQVRNHKVPVYSIEMLDTKGSMKNAKSYTEKWVPMKRVIDNHFMADSSKMTRPYNHLMKFRITSIFGEVVEDSVDTVSNAQMGKMDFNNPTTGKVQFDGGSFGAKMAVRRMVLTPPEELERRLGA